MKKLVWYTWFFTFQTFCNVNSIYSFFLREELNVGTVPMFTMHNVLGAVPTSKMHNVGTVPTLKMYNLGTVPRFKMDKVGV